MKIFSDLNTHLLWNMNFLITLITSGLFAAPQNTSEKKEKVGVVYTTYNILDILYKKRIYLLH
jgi:hypothetical protein